MADGKDHLGHYRPPFPEYLSAQDWLLSYRLGQPFQVKRAASINFGAALILIKQEENLMSRFIDLDIAYVNVDYITRVEGHPDGSAEVYMIDGTMYRCKDFDWAAFEGADHIVGIVPC